MLVATSPSATNLPNVLIAVEFPSSEEAAKFAPQLNEVLPKVLPTSQPQNSREKTQTQTQTSKTSSPQLSGYYVKQTGTLLVITPTPLNLKSLRPPGSKLLAEDVNFRTAHDRFSAESIFVYVDFQAIEAEEENNRKRAIEEEKQRQIERQKTVTSAIGSTGEASSPPAVTELSVEPSPVILPNAPVQQPDNPETTSAVKSRSQETSAALTGLIGPLFGGKARWPQGIGIGLSLENDSFDLRALMVNAPGEKSDVVPFFPMLIPGPAIIPQSTSILPADTELLVMMSLDLDQIYASMISTPDAHILASSIESENAAQTTSPFSAIEKVLGIKVKDDLLPLLGNEIVLSMPVKEFSPNSGGASPDPANQSPSPLSPIVGFSLKDKEGMRTFLPKLIDRLGFAGASSLAQTEKRDDTELVSFANALAYAFIGDFLVISADTKAIHHVVDSYLKQETLSSDNQFRAYTRWQPRQLQGQVYVSPALMESYKKWASEPNSLISDSTRDFLLRLSVVAEPITYSLGNEGMGPLHEVHVPKNLVLMAVAGAVGESSPSPAVANERRALNAIYAITWAESEFKSKNAGRYATLEQLLAENFVSTGPMKTEGYKVEVSVSGSQYQITAVPIEYGKTGRRSFFADESGIVRSGDHGGAPATVSDRPLQ
jgi:hypothetical protein